MGAGDCVDAVELNKPQTGDHVEQRRTLGVALWCITQQMPMQKDAPGRSIFEGKEAHTRRLRRRVSP